MIRSSLILGFSILGLLFSCNKKDRLEGDKAQFIGAWKWINSTHYFGWCDGESSSNILTPITEDINFSMVFEEKGTVQFKQNDIILEEKRIIFNIFGDVPCNHLTTGTSFSIHLDNDSDNLENSFQGCVNEDSIVVSTGFPYSNYEEGCERYISIFIRE